MHTYKVIINDNGTTRSRVVKAVDLVSCKRQIFEYYQSGIIEKIYEFDNVLKYENTKQVSKFTLGEELQPYKEILGDIRQVYGR